MIKEELLQRSPIRILEKSIQGGLKAGEIGIIASVNGIGKTSVLVQLALDKLLQGKKVIHVSFTQHTHYVLAWYENIFSEFISRKNLENLNEVKNELVKNRVLMNFSQDGISNDQILKSLRAMIVEGCFSAEAVIIDGFDFSRASNEAIANIKTFALELGLSVWYSCNVPEYPAEPKGRGSPPVKDQQYDKQNIPLLLKDIAGIIDVVIVMKPKADHIELSISKNRDSVNAKAMAMRLDPKTLLIFEG